jgi:hypothetical protein
MSPKSVIIFILIGILIYMFINDKIELCYIEKFNNQANKANKANQVTQNNNINEMSFEELILTFNDDMKSIENDLNNYKLNFNQKDLRNLKKEIDILLNKIEGNYTNTASILYKT